MNLTQNAAETAAPAALPERRWWVLAVVVTGFFMTMLDTTTVNVAIPWIQEDLHASYGSVEWVVSGYAMAFGLTLIPAGRLGDRLGRRRLFLFGLAGFTFMSLMCALAPNAVALVTFRVIQGTMAGLLNPQILAVIQVLFPPRERGKAFAVYGATAGVGTALGPLLGGTLISAGFGGMTWQPIYLLNVVIGVIAFTAAWRLLPESKGRGGNLDPVGVVLITVALLLVTYPLIEGRAAGWPVWAFAALAAALPALAVFTFWQYRRLRADQPPLVDVRLFHNRAFAAGVGFALVYFAGFTSVFFSLSLWLQIGLGRSALTAGLTILPFAVGGLAGSSASAVATRRLGPAVLRVGTAMVIVGLAAALLTVHAAGPDVSGLVLLPSLAFAGVGSGLAIAPNTNLVLAAVPIRDAGAAGGVVNTAQRVGAALGVALVGVVLFGSLSGSAADAASATVPALRRDLAATGMPGAAREQIVRRFETCFRQRASLTDPGARVPGCPGKEGLKDSPAAPAWARASTSALGRNYTDAVQVSLVFSLAAVALACLLAFFFPRQPAAAGRPGGAGE
ncbi:MFS transporter [Actinomadura graeca]|uniref:MFS transporter n=1 Tax=Actinomadura graeca TaxID=2750812 RepID=A0ABX8QV01_9ACTN|nr:MFS transporter [Actinomadura graeca]QXJ22634.1 MFS transporter [Actinomadura graeca]